MAAPHSGTNGTGAEINDYGQREHHHEAILLPQDEMTAAKSVEAAVKFMMQRGEWSDTGHGSQHVHFHLLNALLHCKPFIDVYIGENAVVGADNPVGLASTAR
mgnify:CR=1 FL=1